MINIEKNLRKLARTFYWQSLYSSSKDIGGVHLFNNVSNFSGIQVLFLYWLRIYSSLYEDLAQQESPYLDNEVIEDEIRCDAYLMYRRIKREKQVKEYRDRIEKEDTSVKNKENVSVEEVVFRRDR